MCKFDRNNTPRVAVTWALLSQRGVDNGLNMFADASPASAGGAHTSTASHCARVVVVRTHKVECASPSDRRTGGSPQWLWTAKALGGQT